MNRLLAAYVTEHVSFQKSGHYKIDFIPREP